IHDADQPATSLDGLLQQLIGMYQKGFSITDVLYTFVSDVVLGPELRFIDGLIKAVIGVELIPTDQLPGVETLDRFLSLTVSEESNGAFVPRATFNLTNIHEVERTVGTWKYAEDQTGPESLHTPPPRPSYALCRHWRAEDCSGFAALRPTSEWNMTAMYTPQNRSAGTDVRLLVELK